MADDGQEDLLEGGLPFHVLGLRGREERMQFRERAGDDDRALVQDGDPIGELLGLVQVLGGEEHGRPAVGQVLDHLPHLYAGRGVQTGGRLVEKDDRWLTDEAHGDVEAPAHAA